MKIADLFKYVGRKQLEGIVTADVQVVEGTKVYVRRTESGYELHTNADTERESELPKGGEQQ
jgi:hypothetical protein